MNFRPESELEQSATAPVTDHRPSINMVVVLVVFISAFLLFLIQPLAAKDLLPRFGGTPSTWGATVVFFQFELLAGYLWAHCLITFFGRTWRTALQSALIFCVCVFQLYFQEDNQAVADWQSLSALQVVSSLWKSWGISTFLLCSTSPLVQGLLSTQSKDRSVYRLYALSNVGSLLGLLLFPLILEPFLNLEQIKLGWSVLYFVYAAFFLLLIYKYRTLNLTVELQASSASKLSKFDWKWFILPAQSSMLLLTVTAYCTHDVAAVPFFWVIPLALYLLSWILTFSELFTYRRLPLLILLATAFSTVLFWSSAGLVVQWILHSIILFAGCTICHGELALRRPANKLLTSFYLTTALGSCFGAVFISFAAPVIFTSHIDYRLSVFYLSVLILLLKFSSDKLISQKTFKIVILIFFIGSIPATQYLERFLTSSKLLARTRNFYGVVEVVTRDSLGGELRVMNSGTTVHGSESYAPTYQNLPIAYYSHSSAVGQILKSFFLDRSRRIGVIGLGVGALSHYARAQDEITFIEINPVVVEYANYWFSFLKSSQSKPTIIPGDARIVLSNLAPQKLDILIVDAFSGDSIPTHLITLQAMRLYLDHINSSDGLLIYHISNRFLSLAPILAAEAKIFGLSGIEAVTKEHSEDGLVYSSQYFIIANDASLEKVQSQLANQASIMLTPSKQLKSVRPWSDSFSNIFSALK